MTSCHGCTKTYGSARRAATSSSQLTYQHPLPLQPFARQPHRCTRASSNLHHHRLQPRKTPPTCLPATSRQQSPTRIPTSSSSTLIHLRISTEQLKGATGAIAIYRPHLKSSTQRARASSNQPSKSTLTTTRTRTGTRYQAPKTPSISQEWRATMTTSNLNGDRQDQMQMRKTWPDPESTEL
jgi:hypothetical protein